MNDLEQIYHQPYTSDIQLLLTSRFFSLGTLLDA